jgi:hypothetical protein
MPTFATVDEVALPPAQVYAAILHLANGPLFQGYGPLPGIAEATPPKAARSRWARASVCATPTAACITSASWTWFPTPGRSRSGPARDVLVPHSERIGSVPRSSSKRHTPDVRRPDFGRRDSSKRVADEVGAVQRSR